MTDTDRPDYSINDSGAEPLRGVDEEKEGKGLLEAGSFGASLFELVNCTIGAGVLTLPFAVEQSGVFFSIIQFIFCAALGLFSSLVLIKVCKMTGIYSYFDLAQKYFGMKIQIIVRISMFIICWGSCVVYTILISNFLSTVLSKFIPSWANFLDDYGNLVLPPCFVLTIVYPLSLNRSLSGLRYASSVGFVFVFFLAFVVLYEGISLGTMAANFPDAAEFDFSGIGTTFPIAVFSFCCQFNIPTIYHEMKKDAKHKMPWVCITSSSVAAVIYLAIGIVGYLSLVDQENYLNCAQNILISYSYVPGGVLPKITMILMCFYITLITPLLAKPAKDSIRELILPKNQVEAIPTEDSDHIVYPDTTKQHVMLVSIVIFSAMLFAMFFPSIAVAIKLVGATSAVMFSFILPCIFYLEVDKDGPKYSAIRLMCYFETGLAIAIALYSVYSFFASSSVGGTC